MNFVNQLSIFTLFIINFAAFGMKDGAAQETAIELTLEQQLMKAVTEAVDEENFKISKTVIQGLLDAGANINIEKNTFTPLILAILSRNASVVQLLLENNAEITELAEVYSEDNQEIKKIIEDAKRQRAIADKMEKTLWQRLQFLGRDK